MRGQGRRIDKAWYNIPPQVNLDFNGKELTNVTLNAVVLKGTFTASGVVTLPAVTLGGAVTGGGQNITGLGSLSLATGVELGFSVAVDNSYLAIQGGADANAGRIILSGKSRAGNVGEVQINTPNAALSGTARLVVSGGVNTAVLTLSAVTVSGLVITNDVGIRAFDVGGTSRYLIGLGGDNEVYLANDAAGAINLRTDNASGAGNLVTRMSLSGNAATAVLTLSAVTVTGLAITNASFLNAANGADGDYFTIGARDSDTDAIVEVARVFGAADPYFSFGGSQQHKFYNSGAIDFGSAAVLACVGTGANGMKLKNLKNAAASALSGTQCDVEIDIGGTPYYFTVYPTKA